MICRPFSCTSVFCVFFAQKLQITILLGRFQLRTWCVDRVYTNGPIQCVLVYKLYCIFYVWWAINFLSYPYLLRPTAALQRLPGLRPRHSGGLSCGRRPLAAGGVDRRHRGGGPHLPHRHPATGGRFFSIDRFEMSSYYTGWQITYTGIVYKLLKAFLSRQDAKTYLHYRIMLSISFFSYYSCLLCPVLNDVQHRFQKKTNGNFRNS